MLLAAEGRSTRSIAEEVGVQPRIVSNWRRRFAEHGLGGLKDRPRGGQEADLRQSDEQAHSGASGKAAAAGLCPMDGSVAGQSIGRR